MSERHVMPNKGEGGGWVVTGPDTDRQENRTTTQGGAVEYARKTLLREGGGTLVVHGVDGAVRERRSVG